MFIFNLHFRHLRYCGLAGVAVLGLLVLSPFAAAVELSGTLDAAADYSATRSNPVRYDVEFVVAVTAPYKTKTLRVWLPIPPSNVAQEMGPSDISTFPLTVQPALATEPVFGNQFAYFEFANPQGAQVIRHKFSLQAYELHWNLDPAKVAPIASVKTWPESFAPYQRSETQAVVTDERFTKLLSEILPQRKNPLQDMTQVMSWVDKNFIYDHGQASLQASSVHGLTKRAGHCSDYHGFCAAMGRVLGYPTRVTYGLNAFPKGSPSHCKLEVFLPPHGWVSFDVSETQKLLGQIRGDAKLSSAEKESLLAAAQARLASGFRDNTWFLQTRGTDYDLVPKASRKVAVVRTIYAEADGMALPEPDPSDKKQQTFAWMTAHSFQPDHPVSYPFTDLKSLSP